MPPAIVLPAFPLQTNCEGFSWSHILFTYGHGAHRRVGDTLFAITALASLALSAERVCARESVSVREKNRMTNKELAKFNL